MAAINETDSERGGRPRNLHLNVVPFIDLMTCLTAFLLVSAVWSHMAQVSVKPGGPANTEFDDTNLSPRIAVLVTEDAIWLGTSAGVMERLDGPDALDDALRHHRRGVLASARDIEIGAEDTVTYDELVAAMDGAIAAGFDGVRVVEPASLSVRFRH